MNAFSSTFEIERETNLVKGLISQMSAKDKSIFKNLPNIFKKFQQSRNNFDSISELFDLITGGDLNINFFGKTDCVKFKINATNDSIEIIEVDFRQDMFVFSILSHFENLLKYDFLNEEVASLKDFHRIKCLIDLTRKFYKHLRGMID